MPGGQLAQSMTLPVRMSKRARWNGHWILQPSTILPLASGAKMWVQLAWVAKNPSSRW